MSEHLRLMLLAPSTMHHPAAFDRATALAKIRGEPIHIVAFDYVEGLASAGLFSDQVLARFRQEYVQHHRQWLEEQALSMRAAGIEVTTEVVWVENPLKEILLHLHEQPIDMLIKDIEHESLLKRAMFTSLDVHLLRECSVPLHFVCKTRNALPRKIVAAVDPFHPDDQYKGFNDRIIYEALKLGMQCKAEVDVLYAHDLSSLDTSEFTWGTPLFPAASKARSLFDVQVAAFDEMIERNGIPAESQHMIMGHPAKVLTNFAAANNIDVIVMGRVHHRSRGNTVGSTVEQILYKMPSSVLVITPEELCG
ncbi:universal stress protein [Pseudomonas sp. Irchel s3a18]|uniref:universal stress protein n=1 Tax=Pseudomonas sp. Irchel s3a18 TaxID=2009053 RepID=UPI000BA4616B|nr:universal stress protein [Pseudomonas sp. Irchel s3a18]